MKIQIRGLLMAGTVALLSACTTMSSLSSNHEGTVVSVRDATLSTPAKKALKSTSFTNFEFKAVDPGTGQPFYGVLPMAFRGGHLAADVILFAPGMFLNLRTAYQYYEFDATNQVVRYKYDESDAWSEYRPTPAEIARAQAYFNAAGAGTGKTSASP
jgi:hypothetical protein